MRVIFAGTPSTSVPSLSLLHSQGRDIVLVITREDAVVGRKRILTPSPVAQWAQAHGLSVLKTNRFDDEIASAISAHNADIGVVVAYGALIPEKSLALPKYGWINLHFSALPDLRGAAPVQRAIMRGDSHIATTVFRLVGELDAGPVWSTVETEIGADETSTQLLDRLARSGAQQTSAALAAVEAGAVHPAIQIGTPTYAPKLTTDEARFREDESGIETYNRFRGVTAEPGFWFMDGNTRIKVLVARLSATRIPAATIEFLDGGVYLGTTSVALQLLEVQPAGKNAMSASDWARGRSQRV